MDKCWICNNALTDFDKLMCKCYSLPDSKDRNGDLACEQCCRIAEKVLTESYGKQYGEKYWEHKDWGKTNDA